MKTLPFLWEGGTPLVQELTTPFCRMSLRIDTRLGPMSLILWKPNELGVRIRSQMYDVAERIEFGVLEFDTVRMGADTSSDPHFRIVETPVNFAGPITAKKLVVSDSGHTMESGLILEADGARILVVAGLCPYTIAVQGVADGLPHVFEPECSMDKYDVVPMT